MFCSSLSACPWAMQLALSPCCFFLLTSRQFSYTTEVACTWTLYFLLSVVSICVTLRASSCNWACMLGRSNGLSCRDHGWPVGPGFFESVHRKLTHKLTLCERAREFAFISSNWEWIIKDNSWRKCQIIKNAVSMTNLWFYLQLCAKMWR